MRVRLRPRLRVDRLTHGDTIQLDLRGRTVELPAANGPALDLLLDGKPHPSSHCLASTPTARSASCNDFCGKPPRPRPT